MREKLHQLVKAGYGLGLLSLNQAKKIAGQVKKDLRLNDEESMRLAKELVNSSEKATKDVLKMVDRNLTKAIIRSKLIKKKDLFRVKNRLRKTWKLARKKRK